MLTFNGRVKILAGTFKTWQELIIAAIAARTYVSAEAKARDLSMWRARVAETLRFSSEGTIFTVPAWKGVVNGVVTQAAWAAGDFTASPGGGEEFDGGVEYERKDVMLSNRVVYAVADSYIDLDVTLRG